MRNDHDCIGHSIQRRVMTLVVIVVIAGASGSLSAQWFNYPSPRAPRTAKGEVDLAAPTPRLANGSPDLSGVWMTAEPACVIRGVLPVTELRKLLPPSRKCPPRTASFSRQSVNIGIDMPGGLPYQPWLAKLVDERTANQSIDDPHIRCLPDLFLRAYGLPHYLKFVQTPDLLLMLNEFNGIYRQVFTDGRPLPEIRTPRGRAIRRRPGTATRWSSRRLASTMMCGSTGPAAWSPTPQSPRAYPAARLWSPRDRGDRRRSEGVYQAVDGDAAAAVRAGHGADRRNLRRRRAVRREAQVAVGHLELLRAHRWAPSSLPMASWIAVGCCATGTPWIFHGFDLNLLVALDALLAEKSVTNAGRRVHLSQSAMSGVLARLRHALNDKLLVASRGAMTLTTHWPSLWSDRYAPDPRAGASNHHRQCAVRSGDVAARLHDCRIGLRRDRAPDRRPSPSQPGRAGCHRSHHPAAGAHTGIRGSRARSRHPAKGVRPCVVAARGAVRRRVHRHRVERAFECG